jgi:hypothetical protein
MQADGGRQGGANASRVSGEMHWLIACVGCKAIVHTQATAVCIAAGHNAHDISLVLTAKNVHMLRNPLLGCCCLHPLPLCPGRRQER